MRSTSKLRLPILAALCLISLAANAQTKDAAKDARPAASPPAAASVANAPERTTATFGDWILRCETPPQQKRICEVAQIVTLQGQSSPVAQIALGRTAPNEPMRLTVVLPTNIAIPVRPQFASGKSGGPATELTWQSCTAAGCFASSEVADDTIAAFAAQTEPGRLLFKDAAGRDIPLPLSFKGLTQAVAALGKETQ